MNAQALIIAVFMLAALGACDYCCGLNVGMAGADDAQHRRADLPSRRWSDEPDLHGGSQRRHRVDDFALV